jgi:hypothetical protein
MASKGLPGAVRKVDEVSAIAFSCSRCATSSGCL